MPIQRAPRRGLAPPTCRFYCKALAVLNRARLRFLVGGAYALERYTGIERHTKDFDVFLKREDLEAALQAFRAAGYHTEVTFPHRLAKAFCGGDFVDIIFSSGNGVAAVDAECFAHAVPDRVFGLEVLLCPPEEIIWSKAFIMEAFIMERERYDGADIAHLIRALGERLDWRRLLARFDAHWRVLFSHLVLFGFSYPSERAKVPAWLIGELTQRLEEETNAPPPKDRVCRGRLISRAQYLIDVDRWAYFDARLTPHGNMSAEEIDIWTAAIEE
jgi:hypothetical protein